MKQLTHGSLFAGIGGFDLGFERAGIKTVWQVEIDPFCRRVLERHFPGAKRFEDVRSCGAENLERVDIITGGFPCQDISQCKTNGAAGLDGERSGLWRELCRIICDLRPSIAVVENVPAILFRGIDRVLGDLAEGGFDAEWDCIPAAAVGAPHIRDRFFLLAYPQCESGNRFRDGIYRRAQLVRQGGHGVSKKWEPHRKLIALVPGIHPRALADWWRTQSKVDRSIDEFPSRLDELHGLGNAVVPQVAEWIGRRIVEVTLKENQ
jgi:DNA (cytosine-5)-methyltransferase 1